MDDARLLRAVQSPVGGVRTAGGLLVPEHARAALPVPPAPLRLLQVHPGADWSTADVYDGYASALRGLGHTVGAFNLHVRVGRAGEWLHWNWERAGSPEAGPTHADAIYLAGCDVVAAALRGDVDWVVVHTGSYLHPDIFVMLRRAGRKVCLLLTESPYEDDAHLKILPLVDVAFTNERTSVDRLRAANPNVYYLPPAYDPARHHPGDPDPRPSRRRCRCGCPARRSRTGPSGSGRSCARSNRSWTRATDKELLRWHDTPVVRGWSTSRPPGPLRRSPSPPSPPGRSTAPPTSST
jgi:hypothetical protein